MRTENERFFRAAKPNAHNSIDNLIMIRVFQIVFGQQVSQILVLNSGRMVAPCGTRRKRFREIFASSLDYMGLVAPEHLIPCRSIMVLATRETRHMRFSLGGLSLGVIFPLAGCVDLVHQLLSPRRRLPSSSSTRQKLWLRNIAAALIVDTITTTTCDCFDCFRDRTHFIHV